jgi:hypothetical protein
MFSEACEDLAYEVVFWRQGMDDPDYPLAHLGALARELSTHLRDLAIMVLLSKGKVDRFQHNLIRSGRVRLSYLNRIAREGALDDHEHVASVCEPLFDAIAAGDGALAQQLARAAPSAFRPGHEYEDDFCYAQVIHGLLLGGQAQADIAMHVQKMAAYLDGRADARLGLCQALMGTDAQAFEQAFADFLSARAQAIDEDVARGQIEEPDVLAQRLVYVEGLAMLRLAQARGFKTEREYVFCPSLARQALIAPLPDDETDAF